MEPFLKPAEYLRLAREIESRDGQSARRLAVLATFTADFLRPALIVESDRLGVPLRPWFGPFQQLEQQVLDERSPLWAQSPDVLWVALRLEDVDRYLPFEAAGLRAERTRQRLSEIVDRLVRLATAIRQRSGAAVLISNLCLPPLFGRNPFDANDPDGMVYLLSDANRQLAAALAAVPDAHVFDYAGVVAENGVQSWGDAKMWYTARTGCSTVNLPVLARAVARSAAALVRPALKCIVLDLDNTLWGGVIGDDGVEGIHLGDEYPGNVFKDFQAQLLGLRRRGFALALASKNDEQTVLDALASHPEMLLKREHFACLAVNWSPKPGNLLKIAEILNIGVDALVFVDDNPVERAQVRAELPAVRVVELPADPLGYLAAMHELSELDRPRLIAEDLGRADMYQADVQRRTALASTTSVEEFLAELRMLAQVGLADAATLPRIHQLIQKTNQFNLTTRRHSLEQVRQLADSPHAHVAWLRLSDRHGDLGLVCVGILIEREPGVWIIDTLLMSCRVMGRKVEQAFLAYLGDLARQAGARQLLGCFCPTAKNRPVQAFYAEQGFRPIAPSPGGQPGEWFQIELTADALQWPEMIERLDVTEHV